MLVLRKKFVNYSVLRNVRITLIILLGIFLAVSLGFIIRPGFLLLNCPAKCVIISNPPSGFNISAATSSSENYIQYATYPAPSLLAVALLVMVAGYTFTIITMFGYTDEDIQDVIFRFRTSSPRIAALVGTDKNPLMSTHAIIVVFNLIFYGLGIWQLFSARAKAHQSLEAQDENIWGLGQVLPLLLLFLPVLQALEVFYGSSRLSWSIKPL
jgi:hypothetical protein